MLIEYHGASDDGAKILFANGWKLKPWSEHYDSGHMQRAFKEFQCIGDAIREVERLTGADCIGDEGQCGESLHCFMCQKTEEVVSGWECGKHLFDKWADTPRKVLEAWNSSEVGTPWKQT